MTTPEPAKAPAKQVPVDRAAAFMELDRKLAYVKTLGAINPVEQLCAMMRWQDEMVEQMALINPDAAQAMRERIERVRYPERFRPEPGAAQPDAGDHGGDAGEASEGEPEAL